MPRRCAIWSRRCRDWPASPWRLDVDICRRIGYMVAGLKGIIRYSHQRKAIPKMTLTSGLVGAEAKGPIGWLIWDNPSKLNALSPGMYEDALSVIEDYVADPAIKVVVMRG